MATDAKRPYDARRRRERATEERQATRGRVVEAARDLFLSRGYVATTMADIAREAGVALAIGVHGGAEQGRPAAPGHGSRGRG